MHKIIYFSLICYSITSSVYALDDVSLPDRIRQEQRFKEFNQQLQNQLPQVATVPTSQLSQNFQQIIVSEQPCTQIDQITLAQIDGQSSINLKQFEFLLEAIEKHPQQISKQCIGTQSLQNLIYFAQNELIKRGFITSQVFVLPQDISQGNLGLSIQVGRLHKIIIQGDDSVSSLQLKAALPFREGDVIRLRQLEQGLENLKRAFAVNMQIIAATENQKELQGYSDLILQIQPQQKVNFNVIVDDSGSDATGKYIGNLGIRLNNPLHLSDIFSVNLSHSLDDLHHDLNKSYLISYQLPLGNYDISANFNQYQYKQAVLGANGTLNYHGESQQGNFNLSRLLSRGGQYKTSLYGKFYHKEVRNFIDDIEIGVQHRKTSGWSTGIQHRQYLSHGVLDINLDYRHGTGAFNALSAPEERIKDIYDQPLAAEGYSRAPIWSADIDFNLPFLLLNRSAQYRLNWRGQYATKLLVPNDRFYIGGRYSVRGFDGDLMLSGDHGHSLQQEINLNTAVPNTQMYLGIDQGWVNGRNSISGQRYLMGSVVGLRSYQNSFYLDVFAGRGLIAPQAIKKDWVTGFSLNLFY
ncbi:ShlB/FhaC/HecB family hemolysin secretion/activation protein [Acinetobacter qingfengensis]|uniref:Hemolysin activator protein n=1 Tax=Acinetobacter qingfengensis TaxID=1262585 RepID=A0A1E7R1Y9_9GAMM|nr:ShlB/FhaC/HecB family hemolysin secretion/activation protein [Acinetobacter qingfengensis]KAA8734859.1 ShlB/FhaC/HecB family hemolysin secretion/activation protein [Acinetobacter qingfengensis]OEY93301.1 hemolysin activator protein [Acinetobacter qingfengensis]